MALRCHCASNITSQTGQQIRARCLIARYRCSRVRGGDGRHRGRRGGYGNITQNSWAGTPMAGSRPAAAPPAAITTRKSTRVTWLTNQRRDLQRPHGRAHHGLYIGLCAWSAPLHSAPVAAAVAAPTAWTDHAPAEATVDHWGGRHWGRGGAALCGLRADGVGGGCPPDRSPSECQRTTASV